MTRIILIMAIALLASPEAISQNRNDGWGQLGEAIFGSKQREKEAYERGVRQALAREQLMADAIQARQDAEIVRIENAARERLTKFWAASGLSEQEASSIASEFRIEIKQISISARAQREGIEKTLVKAFRAYENYDYLLANQLLIAAERITGVTPEQLSAAGQAVQIEKTRIGIPSRDQ